MSVLESCGDPGLSSSISLQFFLTELSPIFAARGNPCADGDVNWKRSRSQDQRC